MDDLLAKAKILVCENGDDCKPRPEAALPLLLAVSEKTDIDPAKRINILRLLGEAKFSLEEYRDAADAFDKASELASAADAQMKTKLLNRAGDSWYQEMDYQKAAERYESSIKIEVAQKDIHLQRARSYQLAGDSIKALTVLIQSIEVLSDTDVLKEELNALASQMIGEENLQKAANLLEQARNKSKVEDALNTVRQKLISNWLTSAKLSYMTVDFETMGKALETAKKFKEIMPDEDEATFLRLSAQFIRDRDKSFNKQAYDEAVKLLKDASEISGVSKEEEEESRYQLAVTYYERGKRVEGEAGKEDLNKAAELLDSLAKHKVMRSYSLLREVNHQLGKDKDTKERLKEIQNDYQAAENLMIVCTNYLYDFQCSLAAAKSIENSDRPYLLPPHNLREIRMAEAYLLNYLYAEAEKRLEYLPNYFFFIKDTLAVVYFYQVWAHFLAGQDKKADLAALGKNWQDAMKALRSGNEPINWDFAGAERLLEQDKRLLPDQKQTLLSMISAMKDKSQPLTSFPQ